MLVATDLDGTLVPKDSITVSPFTAEVLKRVDQAGIPVVFVTARPLRWMDGFWPYVGAHGLAIVSNGAISYDVHERQVLSSTGIDPDDGLEIAANVTASVPGAMFAIECLDGIRLDPSFAEPYPVPVASPRGRLRDIWDVPAMKMLVRHPSMAPEEFHDRVVDAVGPSATTTWSSAGLVEISAKGVTKASALINLCERLSVASSDVVAFGDMPNDVAMLTWAGTSYAMSDAHQQVHAVADHIAPPCTDDGVAHILQAIIDDP